MITIAMAEDHQMLIDGVKSFFEYDENIHIIGTVNNGEDLVKLVSLKQPKLVITDIRMPRMDGIKATKLIKEKFPHINVLALTMFDQPEAIKQMLDSGASGYLLKNSGIKMLSKAIVTVANGETFFDPNVAFNFMNDYINENVTIGKSEKIILSNREKEILHLIANGNTSKEIAEALFIAKTTVDTHRKNMIRKLNLKGGNELVKYAIDKKYQF
ncbi:MULTISPECIES: response regulator [unclassified Tenacibaculum]|uniref:response regulator n=1 Tax=unclassified Tenacibaculum TaxID=2635139 RepID=UPI001F349B6D|nr:MULTISPECIES: response regulator transcription factor [unclassified Tenacibaculum]MCF2874957.1 response regulator transcription factor [Tenacibaculum sp. Cn5-1]MCF2935033.1 response regulator transcription factor [Tenacibaculum sp. Cn5-34]MCG7511525.1 response regulator transcription factor [Tenacibaculum sp. Cn5-46]